MSDRELLQPERTYGKPPPKDSVQKIQPLPEKVDVGTQIVGSYHTFHIADLVSNGYHTVTTATRGAPEFQRDAATAGRELAPYDAVHPLRVMFHPARVGSFDAVFEAILDRHLDVHNNGGSEVHEIKLHGAARNIDDLPSDSERPALRFPEATHVSLPAPKEGVADVAHFREKARTAVGELRKQQQAGVDEVENSAKNFTPLAPKTDWWRALAELAYGMTVAGVAGMISKTIALGLSSVKVGDKVIPGSENGVLFLTDFVKEGIKSSGKNATSTKNVDKATNGPQQFFLQQADRINTLETGLQDRMDNLESLLRRAETTNPSIASLMMRVTAEGIRTNASVAYEQQRRATTAEWLSGLAKLDLGQSKHRDPVSGAQVAATDMRGVPPPRSIANPRGLLRISVSFFDGSISDGKGKFHVYRYKISGVSAESAKELRNVDLRTLPIPIELIFTGSEEGYATRNELGVIDSNLTSEYRGSGNPTEPQRDALRAQQHRALVTLVDAILAKRITDSTLLETDDSDESF